MPDSPSSIRADSDPKYYLRFLIMGIVAFGFALWSLYDGMYGYPAKQERALTYQALEDKGDWDEIVEERGWPPGHPGKPKPEGEFEASITVQFVQAAVATLIAVPLLLVPIRSRGRWIESDGRGISTSWGERIDYDRITNLDKKKWKKGIAKVRYEDSGGRRRTFVLDDYKFQRHPTDAILYELESNIDPEKITGGPPEPPLEEFAEETAEPAAEQRGE